MNNRIPIVSMLTFGILPSSIKKMVYRAKGNKIGKHVNLSFGSVIITPQKFSIGDYSHIGYFSSIKSNMLIIGKRTKIRSAVIINANNVEIGDDVTISETAIIRAGHPSNESNLIIDNYVHIFPSVIIDPSRRIHLMEGCAVGPKCDIFTHGSYKNIFDGYPVSYGNVIIGKRVELTYNVFVAPGVTIGDDAIIAYGSYVNKDIPSGVLAAGAPAKIKREKEQFVSKYSMKEKKEILKKILKDFGDYMIYCSIAESFKLTEKELMIYQKGNHIIIYYEDLYVYNAMHYFDIINLTCSNPVSKIEKELYSFFSRYGVRFTIVDK